mgnify:CR=1 FL=1
MTEAHSKLTPVIRRVILGALLLLLSACTTLDGADSEGDPDLSILAHQAAKRIMASEPDEARYSPMIASSFVNIDDPGQSSTFGRITAEIVASALAQQGMTVREVGMGGNLATKEKPDELVLSRQVQQLGDEYDARSILMGTYAEGRDFLYVSTRLVGTEDAVVLGTADFRLPMDNHIRSLLGIRRF